jgi:transcriptional repressor NrdR
MQCPYCLNLDTKVVDSRTSPESGAVRRRRECEKCAKRFTTYEQLESVDIVVMKKDGRREPFSREKVMKGMLRACEKRPIPRERIERAVAEIESALRQSNKSEIPSKRIGQLVMDQLQQIDEVAYVRFASVYRRFKDPKEFTEEIERLRKAAKV